FTGADLDFSRLAGADMTGANLTAASMEFVWAPKARFVGASLTSAHLQEAKFYHSDFAEVTMEGAFIRYAIWEGVHMEGCTGCPFDW
ncbi:MAG: pentapeptide repeat-containing protein, partial [Pseudomonadota bacterium]